jgi:hypothetical protein
VNQGLLGGIEVLTNLCFDKRHHVDFRNPHHKIPIPLRMLYLLVTWTIVMYYRIIRGVPMSTIEYWL